MFHLQTSFTRFPGKDGSRCDNKNTHSGILVWNYFKDNCTRRKLLHLLRYPQAQPTLFTFCNCHNYILVKLPDLLPVSHVEQELTPPENLSLLFTPDV